MVASRVAIALFIVALLVTLIRCNVAPNEVKVIRGGVDAEVR